MDRDMSFQRVMETARRLQLPLVVTDIAGREPMVVMPLAVYEGLLEAQGRKNTPEIHVPPPGPVEESIQTPSAQTVVQAPATPEEPIPASPPKMTPPSFEAVFTRSLATAAVENPLSVEEYFYLER